MTLHNGTFSTVKTETADVCALVHERLNGKGSDLVEGSEIGQVGCNASEQARNGGNGHRRVRHQIQHGRRVTAWKADTACILIEAGMGVVEATRRVNVSSNAVAAMRSIRGSGNIPLHAAVLEGGESLLESGRRMKNAATAIAALRQCSGLELELVRLSTGSTSDATTMLLNMSSELLTETATELGSEWIWENLVMRAMSSESSKSVTEPVTVTAE